MTAQPEGYVETRDEVGAERLSRVEIARDIARGKARLTARRETQVSSEGVWCAQIDLRRHRRGLLNGLGGGGRGREGQQRLSRSGGLCGNGGRRLGRCVERGLRLRIWV